MTTTPPPAAPKFLLPYADDALGPQNEAEGRLYELVLEAMNSGPSPKTSIAELTGELRSRIRSRP